MVAVGEGLVDVPALPERHGKDPLAVFPHDRLVERRPEADEDRLGPDRLLRIGIVAADKPVAATAVEHADGLMEKEPEPALGVAPKRPQPRAHVQAVDPRVDHEHRIPPGLSAIVAVAREQVGVGPILSTRPAGPEAALPGALHARRHRKRQILLGVGRERVEDERGRDVDAVEQFLRDLRGRRRRIGGVCRSRRSHQRDSDPETEGSHDLFFRVCLSHSSRLLKSGRLGS